MAKGICMTNDEREIRRRKRVIEYAERIGDSGCARDGLRGARHGDRGPDAARERPAAAGFDVSEVRPGCKPGTRLLTVRESTGVATLLLEPAPRSSP